MGNIVLKTIKLHSLQNLLRFQHNLMSFRRNDQTDPFLPGSPEFLPRQPPCLLGKFAPELLAKPITTLIMHYHFLQITDYHLQTNNTLKLPDQFTNNSSIRAPFTSKNNGITQGSCSGGSARMERSKKEYKL
jgi:hypothetical protein